MNIIFFHTNGILPTLGGISRISDTLATLFTANGNNVWYIGMQDKHKGCNYQSWQRFLPSTDLFTQDNINYIADFVRRHKVDAIINQCALDPRSAKFLSMCKQLADFKLVSCFHNSILTPALNGAYQKEYNLKKRNLGWIFSLMKTHLVSSIITKLYIFKHRNRYRATVTNSDKVIVLCDGQVSELYRMCGIESSDKVCVIPNCINENVELNSRKGKIVLWVGTFDYSIKRPDNMLRIWAQIETKHTDWTLVMLGDGPSLEEMKILSKKLGLKYVRFEGRVNPEKYYRQAPICCVTSVHEAFPMVILESQKYGCVPVVNNCFTSAPLLVQDGENGRLVPAFDNKTFAETIDDLMCNTKKTQEMGRTAQKSVQRFSLSNIYAKWMGVLAKE